MTIDANPARCPTTDFNIKLALVLAFAAAFALTSNMALAAEVSAYNVEVKPLPAVISVLPGAFGLGAEGEIYADEHWSAFVDAYYVQLSLDEHRVKDALDRQSKNKGVPQALRSLNFGGGARYYQSTQQDSWFGGGKLAIGSSRARWVYQDQALKDDDVAVTTGLEAGYRWLWDSGFDVRLGGGLGVTAMTRRSIRADGTETVAYNDAKRDLEDKERKVHLTPSLDVGLGWSF